MSPFSLRVVALPRVLGAVGRQEAQCLESLRSRNAEPEPFIQGVVQTLTETDINAYFKKKSALWNFAFSLRVKMLNVLQ